MANKKAGRPANYTKEFKRELAQKLETWINDPKNTLLGDFALEHKFTLSQIALLSRNCPELKKAYLLGKQKEQNWLIKTGQHNKASSMNIFLLKAKHGYKEKQEIDHNINLPKVEVILERKSKK
jgi:hypothetical protein